MNLPISFFFVVLIGASNGQTNCGGCDGGLDIDDECVRREIRTRTVSSNSGWWLNARTTYRLQSYYVRGSAYCCSGYTHKGSQCFADCGGCVASMDRQAACQTSTVMTRTTTTSQSYSCGGWWAKRTCYRLVYTLVSSSQRTYHCCPGYSLSGTVCVRDSGTSYPNCGTSKYGDAGNQHVTLIVGGSDTRSHEYPWQVHLIRTGSNTAFCGGSLIGGNWVLTSAHCVYEKSVDEISVVTGDWDRTTSDGTEQPKTASRVEVYHSYDDESLANDIALVQLSSSIRVNANVRPVCLPTSSTQDYIGSDVIIMGWGSTEKGGRDDTEYPDKLQQAHVTVTSKTYCEQQFSRLLHHVLCATDGAGDTTKSSCFGDSGSPMVIRNSGTFTVIGVASFVAGDGCASGKPFAYTQVNHYLSWITAQTGLS